MIYKFKSAASGDVVMLGPQGDQVLRLLGREPAPSGIVEPSALGAAIAALEAAIAAEAARPADAPAEGDGAVERPEPIGLQRRLWPVIELLRRSQAEGVPVVWGV
ncbi:MAG: DUF1840 family protein [Burkholderiales bacterium]|nr:DUF1840 family protein [Burkholderiales bacterium]